MKITLNPVDNFASLAISRAGDTLTINGVAYDFAPLPDGATLPAGAVDCPWITGPVSRIDGQLHLTLILPVPPIPWPAPPEARMVTHPEPLIVTADGPITLPSWSPPPEPEYEPPPEPVPDTPNEEQPA